MDEQQVAPPDAESPIVPAAAPPSEQAPPATQDGTPQTDANLLRAFTQSQQKLSAVAAALGLPKSSSSEQLTAAINERRRVLAEADAQLDTDPRLAARAAELRAREDRIATQQYGDSAALAATLLDAARGATSILELAEIVDTALIERAATRFAGATPAQAGGSPQPQPDTAAPQAPERNLFTEGGRLPGNVGMFDPEVTATRGEGASAWFKKLGEKVPSLR